MLIKKPDDIPAREITPKDVYVNRRWFMRSAVLAGSVAATGGVYRMLNTPIGLEAAREKLGGTIIDPTIRPTTQDAPLYDETVVRAFRTDEKPTPIYDITHYNNFYEFTTSKQDVAYAARRFVTRPWTVQVEGLCAKPKTFDLDELLKFPQEQRVYRMRCVERWSMVIPWVGFPLSLVLTAVEPLSSAQYVRFETLHDPRRMPNQEDDVLDWPYVEGLRMDEAMHPLTILATGIYDERMPPQNGAPVRLVVPWKYGYKGIKSIVKIQLVEREPVSAWTRAAAHEYGFYSNVNPNRRHPRWPQVEELRIGEAWRPTQIFNGYGEQVAHLYAGMDLIRFH